MNSLQQLHAHSVAKHMLEWTNPFVTEMRLLARPDLDLSHMTVEEFKVRVNASLSTMLSEVEQVIDDMYPNFPPDSPDATTPVY